MEQYGIVRKTENEKALVSIIKSPECDKACSECNLCGNKEVSEWALNTVGAESDDKVKITITSVPFLTMSFTIYILPVTLVVLVYLIVNSLLGEAMADLFSIVTAILSVVIVFGLSKKFFKKDKFKYTVTEIIQRKIK